MARDVSKQGANVFIKAQNFEKAFKKIKSFLKKNPGDDEVFNSVAVRDSKNFEEALTAACFSIKKDDAGNLIHLEYIADKVPRAVYAPFNFIYSFAGVMKDGSSFWIRIGEEHTTYELWVTRGKGSLRTQFEKPYVMHLGRQVETEFIDLTNKGHTKNTVVWNGTAKFKLWFNYVWGSEEVFTIKEVTDLPVGFLCIIKPLTTKHTEPVEVTITVPASSDDTRVRKLRPDGAISYLTINFKAVCQGDGIEYGTFMYLNFIN